jgi:hypothetical protein
MDAELKKAPFALQLFFDVIMLRSTPVTAVVWGAFLLSVTLHVAWACGWLSRYGLGAGFEQSGSSTVVKQQIVWLISNDARYFYGVFCRMPDGIAHEQVSEHLDRLQAEYHYLTNGQSIPFSPCPPVPK